MKKYLFVIFLLCSAAGMYANTETIVVQEAQRAGISTTLAVAVAMSESNMYVNAKNSISCGVMQINKNYASYFAHKYLNTDTVDLFDAQSNARIGCMYLSYLINKFGNEYTACAAYNFGENNIIKHKTLPVETIQYIKRIKQYRSQIFSQEPCYSGIKTMLDTMTVIRHNNIYTRR